MVVMKRKLVKLLLVSAVFLLIASGALFLWPRDRINESTWKKIQVGMAQTEVETILGGHGIGWHDFLAQRDRPAINIEEVEANLDWVEEKENPRFWLGRHGLLGIQFDEKGHVQRTRFWRVTAAEPSFLDRLRDWLGL
jgi:hypothetical protein